MGHGEKPVSTRKRRPFFHLAPAFAQSFGLGQNAKQVQQNSSVLQGNTCEEFNFSKAALRFSDGLTKDQVFSGMRYILQAIGECMRVASNTVIVDFDVGKLTFGSSRTDFRFNVKLREIAGADNLDTYTLLTSSSIGASKRSIVSDNMYPHESVSQVSSGRPSIQPPAVVVTTPSTTASSVRRSKSENLSQSRSAFSRAPVLGGRQELAYRQALSRHLSEMEVRASEAMHAKRQWQDQVSRGKLMEEMESEKRKKLERENMTYLIHQMQLNDDKRRDEKKRFIESASCHNFPEFSSNRDRKKSESVKSELELQIQTDKAIKSIAKLREAQLVSELNEKNRQLLMEEKSIDEQRKIEKRTILNEAWNRDLRLKHCWRAIEQYDMAPPGAAIVDQVASAKSCMYAKKLEVYCKDKILISINSY